MSFAEADAKIKTALDGLSAACTPDIRNRETDIPAVVWSLEDSGATEDRQGRSDDLQAQGQGPEDRRVPGWHQESGQLDYADRIQVVRRHNSIMDQRQGTI